MSSTLTSTSAALGTHTWVERTGGQLTAAERRSLFIPLARTHASMALGRVSMLLRVNTGRRRAIRHDQRPTPTSVLTRAAEDVARRRLSPALLNHSYRTYAYGAAIGELHGVDVDHELLYAAALLHDVGLPTEVSGIDFTRDSARVARDVAEEVGLSTAATDVLRSAITLHHTPGVTLAHGPVAYLLSAGAGLDVVGLRSWQLPPDQIAHVLAKYPRLGFKREFAAAFRTEAQRAPHGRGAFLTRYGAFELAIKVAPFRG